MNVYDFDNTIFSGDSTAGLVGYSYLHRPKTLLNLPRTAVCGLLYLLHIMPKLTFKENLYHMFVYVPDMENFIEQYVKDRIARIKPWYLKQQKPDDMVISASPYFLIHAFCEKLGIHSVIASPVDMHTGRYNGKNCHGSEKVRRLHEEYPDAVIDSFYSDSRSDEPLAEISKSAYLVKGYRLLNW